ncbi:MAG TPA: site-specific integrase [Ktedonobacteraceae bacterium]|nr:site-specific integrase [Ktedonobacteraceae bacterium]
MAKRGNGEGSIYRRKSDGKWTGSVSLDDGKRRVIYGKTRKEVQEKMKALLHEQQQGKLVANSSQTIEQFIVDWLENTHRRKVRPRTYERYREAVYLHIVPALGRIQLQKLTAQQVRAFYTKKEDEGLAASTITCYHSVLHLALDMAVKWGIIPQNVCDLVSPPRRARFEIQPLTTEQAEKLLIVVRGHKWEALYILALVTGLRRGEILGLKWQDIDFKTGTLQVRRILSRVPTKMPGRTHVYVEAEPKTKQSRRSVAIAPFALATLAIHRTKQQEAKIKAGETWQEHDYVFCTSLGTHLNPNEVVKELKKLLNLAGLPNIRFHDLRHSSASLLLSLGIHPKIVQEILGHTQISMTMDIYSHVLPVMHRDAINKLDMNLIKKQEDSAKSKEGDDEVANTGD